MSSDSPPVTGALSSPAASLIERWTALSVLTQTRVKVGTLVVVTILAYHYSLESLLQTIGFDTPLAYVGLVPLFAAGLAVVHHVPRRAEPAIHDRQLDYILGVPLLGVAIAMVFVLPRHLGAMYWVERLDLLSLPIFVAGATVLLFGTRMAWRQKIPILYLFLAWPWPYTSILLGALGGFTSITLAGLKALLNVIPVASPVSGVDNAGLFQVSYHGHSFPVSVVTACSGIDGMVGFLLVGAAFASIAGGPFLRKVLWLATGLLLLWTTNLLRLLLIFWVGSVAGEHLALNVLHPIAGLVIFSVGTLLMAVLARPFGLRLGDLEHRRTIEAAAAAPGLRRPAVTRIYAAAGLLVAISLVLGVNNSGLVSYDPVASAAGAPKLGSFLAQPATPAGWSASYLAEYSINKPLFGESSRWFRYLLTQNSTASPFHSSLPVTADVINAGGLSGFSQFGVAACYSFHGYTLRDVAKVDLGDGISGQALSYSGVKSQQDWSIVYWIWPVETGTGTRYERVILYLQNTGQGQVSVAGQVPGVSGLKGALSAAGGSVDQRLVVNRAFLVAFARSIISRQSGIKDTTVDIAALRPLTDQRPQVKGADRLVLSPAVRARLFPHALAKSASKQ